VSGTVLTAATRGGRVLRREARTPARARAGGTQIRGLRSGIRRGGRNRTRPIAVSRGPQLPRHSLNASRVTSGPKSGVDSRHPGDGGMRLLCRRRRAGGFLRPGAARARQPHQSKSGTAGASFSGGGPPATGTPASSVRLTDCGPINTSTRPPMVFDQLSARRAPQVA
jgi:hypothetical protein